MQMKRAIIISLLFLTTLQSFSQVDTEYYYYKGEKQTIKINTGKLKLICPREYVRCISDTYNLKIDSVESCTYRNCKDATRMTITINPSDFSTVLSNLRGDDNILQVSRMVESDTEVSVSDRFLVNIADRSQEPMIEEMATEMGLTGIGFIDLDNWYRLEVSNQSVGDALSCSNIIFESGLCKDVDPCFDIGIQPYHSSVSTSNQWAIDGIGTDIDALGAWEYNEGKSTVKIAIVDCGIASWHPTFEGSHFGSVHAIPSTADQYFNGVYGMHGTELASVIASNHTTGLAYGISPGVTVLDAATCMNFNHLLPDELAQQISWARRNGADIINCSWGTQTNDLHSISLEQALDSALYSGRDGKGCVVVFAVGNEHSSQISYPANYNADLLAVGAVKKNGTRSTYSNAGVEIDIVAPGDSIFLASFDMTLHASSTPQYVYKYQEGTSFSAAYASGVAGLLLSEVPTLTGKQVIDLIERSAQKTGNETYQTLSSRSRNGTWNSSMGYGLIDAKHVLCTEYSNTTTSGVTTIEGCHVKMYNIDSCGDIEVFYHATVSITDNFYLELGDEIDFYKE